MFHTYREPTERKSGKRWPDTKPLYDDNLAKAAADSGGVLVRARLVIPAGLNGGCGAPTSVAGTNGGELPCGSLLRMFGKTEPYYCAACARTIEEQDPVSTLPLNGGIGVSGAKDVQRENDAVQSGS